MKTKRVMFDHLGKKGAKIHTRKYTEKDKEKILYFLSGCNPIAVGGLVTDVVSGEMLDKENLAYSKDGFLFEENDIYHLKKYDAAVTNEFYDHVMKEK